jgi:hypothetical protein
MGDILDFFWTAFRDYWKVWVTGTGTIGFCLFVFTLVERRRGRPVSWKTYTSLLFCMFWFFGTFSAWHDSQKNLRLVIRQRESDTGELGSCKANLQTQNALVKSWQDRFTDQQKTINALQAPQLQQQATINSCVLSLGKMNPILRKQVSVIPIAVGTKDAASNRFVGPFTPHKVYLEELIIATNVIEERPIGDLRCDNAFNFESAPQLPLLGGMAMVGSSIPQALSDKEYLIRIFNTGSEWGPNSPIYVMVSSITETLGKCTFTPQ